MKISLAIIFVLILIGFCGGNFEVFAQKQKIQQKGQLQTQIKKRIDNFLTSEEQEIFEKADTFEAIALKDEIKDLVLSNKDLEKLNQKDHFHGYKIIKTVLVDNPKDRQSIVKNLFSSLGAGSPSRCFSPIHGLRTTYKDKTIELVICFSCQHLQIYRGGDYKSESISKSLENSLNQILETAQKE